MAAVNAIRSWIVDPQARTVTVLGSDGDAWAEQVSRAEEQARNTMLPGLAIPLPDLWAQGEYEDDENSTAEAQS